MDEGLLHRVVVDWGDELHALADGVLAEYLVQSPLAYFLHLDCLRLFPFRINMCVLIIQSHPPIRISAVIPGRDLLPVRAETDMATRRGHGRLNELLLCRLDIVVFGDLLRDVQGVAVLMADVVVEQSDSFQGVVELEVSFVLRSFLYVLAALYIGFSLLGGLNGVYFLHVHRFAESFPRKLFREVKMMV